MNWIMWTILVLIIVSFLFFGIFPSNGDRGSAASVNGEVITSNELNRVYRNMVETYRQIFKDQFNDSMADTLRKQALRDLIENRLMVQEAKHLGLRITDEEVQTAIMSVPQFQVDGRFSRQRYLDYLDYVNLKPSAFEESQRDQMLQQKLARIIEDGVDVTPDEVAAAFAKRSSKGKKGDFEKEKDAIAKSLLEEKKRAALEAYVQGLYRKAEIKTNVSAAEY
jgi:peptidyl-prolyl cis-trans isomerase D